MSDDYNWKAELIIDETSDEELDTSASLSDSESDDFEVVQPLKLTEKPWLLIGIVSGSLVGLLLLLGGGAWAIMAMSSAVSVEKNKKDSTPIAPDVQSPFEEIQSNPSPEIDDLRARLTKKNRDAELKEFNEKAQNQSKSTKKGSEKTQATQPKTNKVPPPPSVIKAPKIVYRDRPAPPPVAKSQPSRKADIRTTAKPVVKEKIVYRERPQTTSPVVVSSQRNKKDEIDPYTAWNQLTELGSFGSGQVIASKPSNSFSITDALPSAASRETIPVFNPSQSYGVEANEYEVGTEIAVGEVVSGKLLTPIVWAEDMDASGEQVLIELTGTLGDGVLPKGSLVIATVETVSASGAISLAADNVVVAGNERNLPSNALKVTSSNGGYLVGKQRRQGDPFINDFLGAALSGVGSSAGLLNRPRQTAQIGNGGIIQQVTTNRDNDLLGGLVEGFTSEMADRTRSRLESRTNTRSPLFSVKQGTKVKLMVVRKAKF